MSVVSDDSGEEVFVRPPAHPVPTLQGPFEESMVESVNEGSDFDVPIDAVSRRTMLLESVKYERIIAGRWRQRPGEKYHPLWKITAQMTFGLHLLARSLAKSEDEVMKILQAHVDDIDDFLERTSEDFELAHSDMYERLRCLKLPLQHGDVFDRMLEDRAFRASILEGNEKIEHIVTRTRKALKDSLKDVQKGFDATNVLDTYISGLSKTWHRDSPEHEAVHVAMLGNVEGWKRAFMDLHLEGNKVAGVLKKLMEIVDEMEKRAATVSRKQLAMSQASMANIRQASAGSRSSAKPLPMAPTQRHSTRASSRSTNPLRDSSRPFSNGSHDRSSAGSMQSRPFSGRQTPDTTMTINQHAGNDSPDELLMQKTPTIQHSTFDDGPVELPADVPEEALRLAPVSVKNRLSYTLGLKPKDNSDHRISSIYYPKALSDLLKIQQSPPVVKSPQMTVFKQEPRHSSPGDYFSAHIRGSSIALIPMNTSAQHSVVVTPEKTTPSVEDSPVLGRSDSDTRASVRSSSGLNLHSSVMSMAAAPPAPVELPAANEHRRGQESRSSVGMLSSLGEPGPEVASSEVGGEDTKSSDLPTFKIHEPESAKREKFISGIDLPESVMVALAENTRASVSRETTEHLKGPGHALPSENGLSGKDSRIAGMSVINTQAIESNGAISGTTYETNIPPPDCDTPRQKHFVAELEAHVPSPSEPSFQGVEVIPPSDSPIEMEAPVAHFRLPTRASAVAIKVNLPESGVKKRSALVKARVEAAEKESASDPKELIPQPVRPLKLRLAKRDGKMVLVAADSPGVDESERSVASSPRLSTDVIARLIDQMSETPATSPITEESAPDGSPKAVQTLFGPPTSAPFPPAPGGRSMVNPDYANAGAFEGERKAPPKSTHRHSAGKVSSISAWKGLISNVTTRRHSSETSSRSIRQSISEAPVSTQLLDTTTGDDVLWFKQNRGKGPASIPLGVS